MMSPVERQTPALIRGSAQVCTLEDNVPLDISYSTSFALLPVSCAVCGVFLATKTYVKNEMTIERYFSIIIFYLPVPSL